MELLAERGIDVSNRTVLRWVQAFGPQLAAEARKHRRPLGRYWYVDEMFFFRGDDKWYLYRAVDEHGQVVDVLLSEHRDTASAEAFFEQALGRWGQTPSAIITDHHQPYVKAIQRAVPSAVHMRSGSHRATGETTKPIERSHVPTRDRLLLAHVGGRVPAWRCCRPDDSATCPIPCLSQHHTMSQTRPAAPAAARAADAVIRSTCQRFPDRAARVAIDCLTIDSGRVRARRDVLDLRADKLLLLSRRQVSMRDAARAVMPRAGVEVPKDQVRPGASTTYREDLAIGLEGEGLDIADLP